MYLEVAAVLNQERLFDRNNPEPILASDRHCFDLVQQNMFDLVQRLELLLELVKEF